MEPNKIIYKFESLESLDAEVLKIMSVYFKSCSRQVLTSILIVCGKSPEITGLNTPQKISPIIDRLVKSGLINKDLSMELDVADFILKYYVDPDFARMAAEICLKESNYKYYPLLLSESNLESTNGSTARLLRCSILCGDQKVYFDIKNWTRGRGFFRTIICGIYLKPFRTDLLETIPGEMAADILETLISSVFHDKARVPEYIFSYYIEKFVIPFSEDPNLPRRLYILALNQLFLNGSIDIPWLETHGLSKSSDFYGLYGLDLMISGKKADAIDYWKENIEFSRKVTRKKTWMIPGICGHIYIFLGLNGQIHFDEKSFKSSLNFLTNNKDHSPEFEYVTAFLLNAFQVKTFNWNMDDYQNRAEYDLRRPEFKTGLTYLFHALASFATFDEMPDFEGTPCLDLLEKIRPTGSPWIIAELNAVLEKLNLSFANDPDLNGVKPFIADLMVEKVKWKCSLETIKAVLNQPEDKQAATAKRLIWILDLTDRRITPTEQKLNAKGVWTAGKKLSIRTLKNERYDYFTEQDIRVISSAETYYERFRGYEFELRLDKSLPLLENHPLVFLKNADKSLEKVEILKGKPSFSVKKSKNGVRLEIHPFPKDFTTFFIKEPPSKIKVVQFPEILLKIASTIGNEGLFIPTEAEDEVRDLLASVSPYVDISSDLAASEKNMETVEANSTPNILLYPSGQGIKADIRVLPLGENGPSFKPGQGGEIILGEIDGKKIQTVRNIKEEKKLIGLVIKSCPSLEHASKSMVWYSEEIEEILELVTELKEVADQSLCVVSWPEGERYGIKAQLDMENLNIKISSGIDWFEMKGSLKLDETEKVDISVILKNISNESRFVKIGENEFLALSRSLHKKLLALENASEATKTGLKVSKGAAVMLREAFTGIKGATTDKGWNDYQKKIDEALSIVPEVPSTLQAELRPYQAEGYTWLCRLAALGTGACLADDMGLGKTIQTLALLIKLGSKGPSLVVAPTSVCGNWLNETARFAPTLNPIIFGSGDREQMIKNLGPMDLLIVSYGLLQQMEKLFDEAKWNVVVLDEAQAIKNETAKRTQAALKLSASFRLITTGTPVENSLDELFTLFSFINPGLLGSRSSFNEKYAIPIEREKNKTSQNRLRQLIRPFILRRLRSDVLDDLPEKTEIILKVEPDEKQKEFYRALRNDVVSELEQSEGKPAGQRLIQILAGITKLRLASCHPELAVPGCGVEGSKTETFMELVEELIENRHKALVFSQFTSFLSIVRKELDKKGIRYLYLDGSTPPKKRNESVAAFQAGEADLFLISLKAGGTGLNLTAANYVIHLDPWWNPAVEDQASARAHRMGQKQPVTIYRLVMSESIEEKIMSLHKHKKNLAESILEGTETTGKMSAEELMNLIKNS